MRRTTQFKSYILEEEILMMPVAHDALTARMIQQAGFKATCAAGYANSAALLGKPDVSLLTLTEMVECASRIVDAVDIPVFADGDTGYGNVTNVIRTVQLFEKAGCAGLLIEDQLQPKRCGHMSGKQVTPAREMAAKIRAALDARRDPDFVIMARTDALAVEGLEAALSRAHLYREAGADMIFVEAPESVEQMTRIAREVDAPQLANMIPGGKTPCVSARELQEMGFAAVAFPTACTYALARAVQSLLVDLWRTGTLSGLEGRMMQFEEFNRLVGLQEIRDREDRYCIEGPE
ncbi:MAG: oxaloacetate decarboxylase [Methanosarcinales archaeon]|nr:oxaloacetate decarboxylase [Methanosarcinales archaeon]